MLTLIGGMWSVTLTDTLQILVAIAGLIVLTSAALSDPLLGNGNPFLGVTFFLKNSNESPSSFELLA